MASRREFLTVCGKLMGGAALGSLMLPVLESCLPSSAPLGAITGRTEATIDVSDLTETNPVKVISDLIGPDGKPVMVTRVHADEFKALSMNCTHQGCTVESSVKNGLIPCLCHNSTFALDGSVVSPPATIPLREYKTTFDATARTLHVTVS